MVALARVPQSARTEADMGTRKTMGRLFKLVLFLIVIGALGLVGYAYLGDLSPDQDEVTEPVEFDAE